ncbi:MAG: hypothetical protein ACXVHL_35850 [Solirubrobacteraceae bacterium]
MKELHITVPVQDDAQVETLVDALAIEAAALDIETVGYHVHEHHEQSGEIVGWQVVSAPSVRDFHEHAAASLYASRTGGALHPIFAPDV